MKKIPTLFVRDWDGYPRYVLERVTPGCEWVMRGEGIATRKYDGTCVMFDGERWWARREVKQDKKAPAYFIQVEHDEETGRTVGWEPAQGTPFARYLDMAVADSETWLIGTYELIGPKINGNPERVKEHLLVQHAQAETLPNVPLSFEGLQNWLHACPYEGIVWHHPDGRMAKIKKRDFRKPS